MNNQPKTPHDPKREPASAGAGFKLGTQIARANALTKTKRFKIWGAVSVLTIIIGVFILELHLQGVSWSDTWHAMLSSKSTSEGSSPNHPRSGTYLWAGLTAALWIYIWIDSARRKRRQKEEQKAEAAWHQSLAPLVDISDYPDREDLYFYLEPEERPRLLDALRRMPKGSRSLRSAVKTVDPDLLDEPG